MKEGVVLLGHGQGNDNNKLSSHRRTFSISIDFFVDF